VGKYLYPDLTPDFAAVVSTHGYFEIQKRETYNSYASGFGPVYRHSGDGTRTRMPDPVVVFEGWVSELGITYGPDDDIHFDGEDEEDDGHAAIRQLLLAYLAQRATSDPSA
jgi:hypothetical protein